MKECSKDEKMFAEILQMQLSSVKAFNEIARALLKVDPKIDSECKNNKKQIQ